MYIRREIEKEKFNLFSPDIDKIKKSKPTKYMDINEIYERILKGSFPALYKEKINIDKYYSSYINTYLEKDVKDLIGVKNEVKFYKFMISLAARTGCILNIKEVCQDLEITNYVANEWLSILVNTSLIYLLEPFSNNISKRVIKSPKIYFMDTGLACHLCSYYDSNVLEKSAYNGQIFETYVISEIIKNYENNGINTKVKLSYYRDNHKREIDLIIEENNCLYPIEIKKSKSPDKSAIKNFDVLNDIKGKEIRNGLVLCNASEITPIDINNYSVPINYI